MCWFRDTTAFFYRSNVRYSQKSEYWAAEQVLHKTEQLSRYQCQSSLILQQTWLTGPGIEMRTSPTHFFNKDICQIGQVCQQSAFVDTCCQKSLMKAYFFDTSLKYSFYSVALICDPAPTKRQQCSNFSLFWLYLVISYTMFVYNLTPLPAVVVNFMQNWGRWWQREDRELMENTAECLSCNSFSLEHRKIHTQTVSRQKQSYPPGHISCPEQTASTWPQRWLYPRWVPEETWQGRRSKRSEQDNQ